MMQNTENATGGLDGSAFFAGADFISGRNLLMRLWFPSCKSLPFLAEKKLLLISKPVQGEQVLTITAHKFCKSAFCGNKFILHCTAATKLAPRKKRQGHVNGALVCF